MTKKVVPMIHVPDVAATVEWYRDIGFSVVETHGHQGEGLSFAIVAFGDSQVMFSEGGGTSTQFRREVDLYVYADDVDEIYERLKNRVEVVEGLHDTFYGMRELIIRDLNRFWITFGQPSAYGILMNAVHYRKPEAVRAALEHARVGPQGLTNALVAATDDPEANEEIVALLKEAGALPPPELDPALLQAHTGLYKGEKGMEAKISLNDGKLYAEPGGEGRLRLIAIDQNTFRPLTFDRVTVRFKVENGKTLGFTLQDGGAKTEFQRIAEVS
jgi:catechol 2,3-dioxygenase-like lactoylglutathione lyase family enzyme